VEGHVELFIIWEDVPGKLRRGVCEGSFADRDQVGF
jgi:hypothetical protein